MASKCPPLQVAVVLEGRRAVLRGQLTKKGLPGLFFGARMLWLLSLNVV